MTRKRSVDRNTVPRATPASTDAGVVSFAREQAWRAARAEHEAANLRIRVDRLQRFLRHDARTPLTIVLGHAQMLAEGMVPEARRGASFEVISRQIDSLGEKMDALGVAAPAAADVGPVWVRCPPGLILQVRAALRGLPAIVCPAWAVAALRRDGEPVVDVDEGWSASDLYASVSSCMGEAGGWAEVV